MSRRSSRLWLALLLSGAAWCQAPSYSSSDLVNASDYTPAPFAPNSVLALFGTNLSWTTHVLTANDIAAGTLPISLANVEVYVDNYPAPLLYVSPTQINFLIPSNEISGDVSVRVAREGVSGPLVTVSLVDAAPALFPLGDGYVIATHLDGTMLDEQSPAQPGETVVVYATGLGRTQPNPAPGEIPQTAAAILNGSSLTISLDGAPLDGQHIKYAGLTAFCVGLYQLNIVLPGDVGPDPAIVVTLGAQSSPGALQLAVQPAAVTQLFRSPAR